MSDLTSETEVAQLRAQVIELQRDNIRWANANRILSVERDHYRAMAELNAETIKNMNVARRNRRKGMPPKLCSHDDGSHCDESCEEKVRKFLEYHGLPAKGKSEVEK